MARGNMSFRTAFTLDAKQFNNGVKQIQTSLKGLKSSFLDFSSAIGLGLGMTSLISNLKETAVKMSVAQQTLQNVSKTTTEYEGTLGHANITLNRYQENLKFVKELSQKYGQDLIVLTHEYAQFTAAADGCGMSLKDQRVLYEALVRAAATFHMSEDKTRDMMVAVTQMMSKGKITAEELRRQLGNHLPGAFNLMAKAAGVSTGELEKMMRDGDAIATKYLPMFAVELNKLTKNAHFESLQMSLNQFKNAWYGLTEATNFEKMFTNWVDAGVKSLNFLADHFKSFRNMLLTLILSGGVNKLAKGFDILIDRGEEWYGKQISRLKAVQKQSDILYAKLEATDGLRKTHRIQGVVFEPKVGNDDKGQIQDLIRYNNTLIEQKRIRLQIGDVTDKERRDLVSSIKNLKDQNSILASTHKLTGEVSKEFSTWQKLGKGINATMKTIGATIKSIGIAALISAIAGLITDVINKHKEWKKELERINNIYSDYEMELRKSESSVTAQEKQLHSLLKVIKDVKSTEEQRKTALNEIKRITGSNIEINKLEKIEDAYDRIKQAVADWIKLEKIKANISILSQKNAEAEARNEEIRTKRLSLLRRKLSEEEVANSPTANWFVRKDAERRVAKLTKRINALDNELRANNKIIDDSDAKMQGFHKQMSEVLDAENNDYGDGNGNKKGIAKIYDDYAKEKKELANKLKEQALTEEAYNKELDKLNKEFWLNAAATGELRIEEIIKKQDAGRALTAIEKWYVALRDGAIKAAQNAILDGIAKSIIEDIDEALENDAKELEKEFKKILENEEKRIQVDMDYAGITSEIKYQNSRNKRDGTFDYKKSRADIFGEEANIANENLDRVMDGLEKVREKAREGSEIAKMELSSLQEYYKQLAKEARTIEEAYKFEQIKEDIKNFEQEITSATFDGIENFASSLDRVVSGAKQLRDIMENTDSTGWEKIMGVVNYIFNILNAVTSVIETVNTLTEMSNMLAGARAALDGKKNADSALELETTVAQVAAEESLSAVKAKEAAYESTITANKIAQAEAIVGVTTALGAEAAAYLVVAEAAKKAAAASAAATAAAGGPAAAIAATEATLAGMTAALAAFEHGGIVGGNSTRGDRNIIRANTGELILNKAQQGTLYRAIASGNLGGGGGGEWRVRGTDLIKVINNTQSKLRG